MEDTHKPDWVKFRAERWLSGTAELTAAERGVYITICAYCMANGVGISRRRIERLFRGEDIGAILDTLVEEGKLTCKRKTYENSVALAANMEAVRFFQKSKENGSKGGKKRWSKNSDLHSAPSGGGNGDASAEPNGDANTYNTTTQDTTGQKKGKKGAGGYKFSGAVIRLTEADYETWEKRFDGLDLQSELVGIDQWLEQKGIMDRWFHRVEGMLRRKCEQVEATRMQHVARAQALMDGVE